MFVIPQRRTVTKMSNVRTAVFEGIAASTVLPLLSVAADRRRNCIDKLPWMNALKRSCTQPGVKITFSLMTNLKQATLDMCKSTAGRCVRSVDQELGGLSFWLMCVSSTQLARLCSCCCRYFDQCQIDLYRSDLGRCWWLHPYSAADPGWLLREILLLMDNVLHSSLCLSGKLFPWSTAITKANSIKRESTANIIPSPPSAEDLI